MLQQIIYCAKQEMKKSPRIESAIVSNVNNNGTVDVIFPSEENYGFKNIQNQTPFELKKGDSVEIMLKDGSFNNCWVMAKHGEMVVKGSASANYRGGGFLPQPSEIIYVVGEPLDFVLTNWDEIENGHTYVLKVNGSKPGKYGVQIGLPKNNDSYVNTQQVIDSALTVPNIEYTVPDIKKNIAGYTMIYISCVDVPKNDITIALFGLDECDILVTVTQKDILGIKAPVKGEFPVKETNVNEQYDATVVWNPADGVFKESTSYSATITLTPKRGYKLDGVPENFFTLNGATTITNQANSGIVQVTFPMTAAK